MFLRTLGGLVLEGSSFRRQKPLLVLAFLALEGPTSRRYLAELFWPNATDARDSLSTTLRRLAAVDASLLAVSNRSIEASCDCDASEFLRPATQSLALYRGPFLEGTDVVLGEELEEWQLGMRQRLVRQARGVCLRLAREQLALGNTPAAASWAEQAFELEPDMPWLEGPLRDLVQLLDAVGSARLTASLNLAVAGSYLPVAPDDPAPTGTGFVGRSRELALLRSLLHDSSVRLLTLHGPGGIGKSRLARETISQMGKRDLELQSTCSVQLEAARDSNDLADAVTDALGLPRSVSGDARQHLLRSLADRRLLLVLDNLEHEALARLVDAALVRRLPNGRYELHMLIHQFAADKLTQMPDAGAGARESLARYFLGWLREHDHDVLGGPGNGPVLAAMDAEMPSMRKAWLHGVNLELWPELDGAAPALVHHAITRGTYADVCALFQRASTALEDVGGPAASLGRILGCAAFPFTRLGRHGEAIQVGDRAVELLEATPDADGWGQFISHSAWSPAHLRHAAAARLGAGPWELQPKRFEELVAEGSGLQPDDVFSMKTAILLS